MHTRFTIWLSNNSVSRRRRKKEEKLGKCAVADYLDRRTSPTVCYITRWNAIVRRVSQQPEVPLLWVGTRRQTIRNYHQELMMFLKVSLVTRRASVSQKVCIRCAFTSPLNISKAAGLFNHRVRSPPSGNIRALDDRNIKHERLWTWPVRRVFQDKYTGGYAIASSGHDGDSPFLACPPRSDDMLVQTFIDDTDAVVTYFPPDQWSLNVEEGGLPDFHALVTSPDSNPSVSLVFIAASKFSALWSLILLRRWRRTRSMATSFNALQRHLRHLPIPVSKPMYPSVRYTTFRLQGIRCRLRTSVRRDGIGWTTSSSNHRMQRALVALARQELPHQRLDLLPQQQQLPLPLPPCPLNYPQTALYCPQGAIRRQLAQQGGLPP
ncbi:hypothetical protein C8Q80DRAFT_623868 [Daedaleopsis nitida]|nr:hypothetical protein C8Q80DRAFT_623868 [Daedaleopsis nitida]